VYSFFNLIAKLKIIAAIFIMNKISILYLEAIVNKLFFRFAYIQKYNRFFLLKVHFCWVFFNGVKQLTLCEFQERVAELCNMQPFDVCFTTTFSLALIPASMRV